MAYRKKNMALESTTIKSAGGESGCRNVIKKSDCRKINERKGGGGGGNNRKGCIFRRDLKLFVPDWGNCSFFYPLLFYPCDAKRTFFVKMFSERIKLICWNVK